MSTALMIVDVQQGMFSVSQPLHRGEEVVQRIAGLLARARAERRRRSSFARVAELVTADQVRF